MRVAVLGTGTMGAGMARSLLRAGHEVAVWNRSHDRSAPLVDHGARVSESAAEAVAGAEVVLTMLFDADSVIAVMDPVLDRLGPDTVWLQSATVGLEGIARIAALARDRDVTLVDGPVLGTKQPAEQGTLVVLVAGDPATVERVAPVLDAIGAKTVRVGDEIGAASALKLVCNAWIGSITAAVGQSIALADRLGVDPTLFLEAISGGASDNPYAQLKGKAMIAGEYSVSFTVDGVLKDLDLILDAAEGAAVEPALLAAVHRLFRTTSDAGRGGEDMAAVRTAFGR